MTVRRVLDQVNTVARFELHRFHNSLRIVGILATIGALAVAILVVPTALGQSYRSSVHLAETFGFFVPLLSVALALLFGADSLVREFTHKTGYTILPNPVSRSRIVGGKFMASIAASWFALFVYYVIAFAVSMAIFGQFAVDILSSYAYALLYTVAIMALAFLVSAAVPTITSSVTALFLLLVLFFPWAGPQVRNVSVWNLAVITEAGSLTHRLLASQVPTQVLIDALVTVGLYSGIGLILATGVFIYREE